MKALFIKIVHSYSPRLVFGLLAIILVTTGLAVSCVSCCGTRYEFFAPLTVENRTGQTISVFVTIVDMDDPNTFNIGNVAANKTRKFDDSKILLVAYDKYLIEAKSDAGDTIFSKTFTLAELQESKWKITVSSS
jgi:hypothetical protein